MKYRKLGKSNVEVSEISLGCWTMGGLNWVNGDPNGWANVDEKEVAEAINYAIDEGVNHFDNADVYGNGRAERMLARILGNRTNNFIIATKVGWFPGTAAHAYEPTHIRHQCEQSLINLKRDYIDLYYFHHGWFGDNNEYLDGAVEVMYKLKDEGKVRLIGQSAYSHEDFQKLIPKVKPDVIQTYANAVERRFLDEGNPTRRLVEENQISLVAFRPLYEGLLLDKYKKENPPQFENGDHRKEQSRFSYENLVKLETQLNKIKAKFGSSIEGLARVAQQFVLKYNFTAAVIPGFRNLKQVKINLSAMDKPLTDNEFEFVKSVFTDY
ncbi:MAG: aldo/keto reductase [Ignavibacteriaceae bacterium]|jgi:aryl-alcohol dehydrogenase-like predicted oxidoreductase|nr:aldo/keto reductase [Chlorobium sp.]MCW8824414.1 aldo/keto reductase [Ignavibacteriaceae bacterium]MCW8962011.1 aldo/keto reductase [Ignavibacteriaceae bacterium]MCW8997053.1 aldo/keto reductase [Psychromonas sp.]MCW9097242.1 aldo/keto reductase [Ignavibacteriaceae bacterium]